MSHLTRSWQSSSDYLLRQQSF